MTRWVPLANAIHEDNSTNIQIWPPLPPHRKRIFYTVQLEPVTSPNVHNTTVLSAICQSPSNNGTKILVQDMITGEDGSPTDIVLEEGVKSTDEFSVQLERDWTLE